MWATRARERLECMWAVEEVPIARLDEVVTGDLAGCCGVMRTTPLYGGATWCARLPQDRPYTWLDVWRAADVMYRDFSQQDPDHAFIESFEVEPPVGEPADKRWLVIWFGS